MTVLQTAPLPLGYDAITIKSEGSSRDPSSERWDSNPRPSRWQRDALPAELLSQKNLNIKRLRVKFYIKYLCITTFFYSNDQDNHHHHDHEANQIEEG